MVFGRIVARIFIIGSISAMLTSHSCMAQTNTDNWFGDAKFGMFIHWNFSVLPEDIWKKTLQLEMDDANLDRERMFVLLRRKLPVASYRNLAKEFNPSEFNAKEWVKVAKCAGAKYIVFTAKHHDGFAMFDSNVSDYNIVKSTPFARDPVKELAQACREEGIKFCLYYSHAQDWDDPDGAGNTWDYKPEEKKFDRYLERKCKPQVTELLTNYGPVGLIWFDTPRVINKDQSESLFDMVKKLQPNCLVNSRIGGSKWDYLSMGDNLVPPSKIDKPWETAATINDHWAYKASQTYKDPVGLIRELCEVVSKGGNLLLNVGPDEKGTIPKTSSECMKNIGEWLAANNEAIYGSTGTPFNNDFPWGVITSKPGKLYLHVFDWPKNELIIYGLKSKVTRAYFLAGKMDLNVDQTFLDGESFVLKIHLPEIAPDKRVTVIALDIEEPLLTDDAIVQQPNGVIDLEIMDARIIKGERNQKTFVAPNGKGYMVNWFDNSVFAQWRLRVLKPGNYGVSVITAKIPKTVGETKEILWESGHQINVTLGDESITASIEKDNSESAIDIDSKNYAVTHIGQVQIPSNDVYTLTVKPSLIVRNAGIGFALKSVKLIPVSYNSQCKTFH